MAVAVGPEEDVFLRGDGATARAGHLGEVVQTRGDFARRQPFEHRPAERDDQGHGLGAAGVGHILTARIAACTAPADASGRTRKCKNQWNCVPSWKMPDCGVVIVASAARRYRCHVGRSGAGSPFAGLGGVETPLADRDLRGSLMGKLDGKVAIITGGARGQGEAHARLFVEEGAHVVIGDVLDDDGQRVASELGAMARYVRLDVSRADDWSNAVAVAESMGPLRVLVNNAAIHWTRPIEFETADGFERIWRVNLLGAFSASRRPSSPCAAPAADRSSTSRRPRGLTGLAYHGAYGSAKWGMRGLTRTAAVELGRDGIRVNSIHPGPINTSMMTRSPGIEETDFDERFQHLPARRCGEPREVSQLVVFLASDDSAFITGTERNQQRHRRTG